MTRPELAAACLTAAAVVLALLRRRHLDFVRRLVGFRAATSIRGSSGVDASSAAGGLPETDGAFFTGGIPGTSGSSSTRGTPDTGRFSATGGMPEVGAASFTEGAPEPGAGTGGEEPTGPDAGGTRRGPDRIRLGAGLAGLAVALLVGGWSGCLAGVLAALAADRLLRRMEPRAVRERRLRESAELPLAADLLAAALRAGAPVDRSVLAVADALGGPLAVRLDRIGRTLLLGGGPEEAWAHLDDVPGADRMVTAALRSSRSGAALAGALTRVADDLRADRSVAAEASARRAGVLIVLPLGLCFLPAFILAGLVPVIVAVLGDVL